MEHKGTFCLPLELKYDQKDEVAVKWDEDTEEYVILATDGTGEVVLHEDGTWRKPHPHALIEAWRVMCSMNKRIYEGERARRNKM